MMEGGGSPPLPTQTYLFVQNNLEINSLALLSGREEQQNNYFSVIRM